MRVLLVCPQFHPSVGGVETHVREVAQRLPPLGIETEVLTTDATGRLATWDVVAGVPVRRIRAWPSNRDWMAAPGLPAAIRAWAPDVVHVHSFQTMVAPVAVATVALSDHPLVVTFHRGGHRTGLGSLLPTVQLLTLAPMLRRAAGLVAVSQFEADSITRSLGLARLRVRVIPNGARLPEPSPGVKPDPGLLVSLGRLEPYKGHDLAVATLAGMVRDGHDVRLRILGAGRDAARLRQLADASGVGALVEISSVSGTSRQVYTDELARASCVLVLSGYESQGIAAWEAAGLGRPLVVLDDTALAELVDLGAAIGVAPGSDAAAVGDAVRAARARVQAPFPVPSWEDCAQSLSDLYQEVAG